MLHAQIGDVVAIVRRRGKDWYVGALTDWRPRELVIDLSFLPAGGFSLDSYQDGVNADRPGSDYQRVKRDVDAGTRLTVEVAPGGGWAARLVPID